MQIETTHEADAQCKDLIGESYEAAYKESPDFSGFSGLVALWANIEKVLKFDLSTTRAEDNQAMDLLEEVFEKACRAAEAEGHVDYGSTYVDYQQLWERLCAVIGVSV
jgi:hypothetical protein